jgi:hypothetical protein
MNNILTCNSESINNQESLLERTEPEILKDQHELAGNLLCGGESFSDMKTALTRDNFDQIQILNSDEQEDFSSITLQEFIINMRAKKKPFRVLDVDKLVAKFRYVKNLLSVKFYCQVSMNLYTSLKGVECLTRHQDEYPILIYQLIGKKKWFFDDSQIVVNEGDFLLIPVGQFHHVETITDTSAHLTIGLHFEHISKHLEKFLALKCDKTLFVNDKISTIENKKRRSLDILKGEEFIDNFSYRETQLINRKPSLYYKSPYLGKWDVCIFFENILTLDYDRKFLKVKLLSGEYTLKLQKESNLFEFLFSNPVTSFEDLCSKCDNYNKLELIAILRKLKKNKVVY